MTETWEKQTCFQKFLFLRIGLLPFRSSASPHSSSRISCDHLPASLSFPQIGTDQKAFKTEAKIIQDMKILSFGGEKSTCFFSFLAYPSFKVENRIEWCFQPIQVFYHQFISSTNTGRLFLSSGLNEVSCRCDLKRRVEENEGKAGSRKVEEKIIPDIQKRIANKLQFPLEGCVSVFA